MAVEHNYKKVDDMNLIFNKEFDGREIELDAIPFGIIKSQIQEGDKRNWGEVYSGILCNGDKAVPFQYPFRYGQLDIALLKAASENKELCKIQGVVRSLYSQPLINSGLSSNYVSIERVSYRGLDGKLPSVRLAYC